MFRLASFAAVLALALGARADLSVDTPSSATQCQGVTFQISGSTPGPYFAYIVNSSDPCGDALDEVQNISGTSFTWTPKVAAGTSIQVAIESNDGTTEGWSGPVTVGAGDTSCLSSGAASATSTTASTTASVSRTVAHNTASQAPANAASDVPSTDASTNGAGSRAVVGVSSIVALVGAAVAAFAL